MPTLTRLRSQQAADAAAKAGVFKEEIVPVEVKQGKKSIVVSEDDHRRPETTMETLSKLPPSFQKDGIVTAGNASGIVDGAAAVVVTREKTAKERGLKPLGRIVSWAAVGVDPSIMGIGPVPSTRKALQLAGLKLEQIDRVEVNEAFAAQYLAVEKELGLSARKNQCERRRHRPRASAGRIRHAVGNHRAERTAAQGLEVWPGDSVHRRRPGNRHDRGSARKLKISFATVIHEGCRTARIRPSLIHFDGWYSPAGFEWFF